MKYNIDVNVEDGEIAIRNSHGDLAIIPKDKRDWVKQKLSEGCHDCIDSLVETLPVASQYAQDGSVYPPNTKVKVSHNNQIKEYDISSPEYRDLYNSGKLMSYDKTTDTYSATPLKEVTITAEAPQWLKDKRRYEFEFTKDMFIDKNMPKFSRAMGVSANNMHPNNVKEYDNIINDKVAESILKRNLKVGTSANDRLKWYNSLSEKEREIVNNSYSADKFSPAVRAYMESQSNEAKKYGILETFRDADKLAQSVEGTPERFRIFPNAENNYENYVNPLMWIGDMAKGLGNVSKDIKEENYLKAAGSVASPLLGGALGGLGAKTTGQFIKNTFLPLGGLEENIVKGGKNLVGAGLVGKLSKADKVIDAVKVGTKMANKTDDVLKNLPKLEQIPVDYNKIEDLIKNFTAKSDIDKKNSLIMKEGNKYFKELNNSESLKRLKEFGEEYNIDLLDAYKKAEKRWDYNTSIGKHNKFQVAGDEVFKDDIVDAMGVSTLDPEGLMKTFLSKDKNVSKDLSENSINYINKKTDIRDYHTVVWHELSHDINKQIIGSSSKLQKEIGEIFIDDLSKLSNENILNAKNKANDLYKSNFEKSNTGRFRNNKTVDEIAKDEFNYITEPTETWAFLSTNLRQDLKNTGLIKDYNQTLTSEILEQAIKNNNTVFSRFEPYIKDKDRFIKLFNKMTLSIAPAALYLQSQQNKSKQ